MIDTKVKTVCKIRKFVADVEILYVMLKTKDYMVFIQNLKEHGWLLWVQVLSPEGMEVRFVSWM